MPYEQQTWNAGDPEKSLEENLQNNAVATAAKMNHIEAGIAAVDTALAGKANSSSLTGKVDKTAFDALVQRVEALENADDE